MAFAPDLGIYLLTNGTRRDTDLTFNGMLVPQLGTSDGAAFCCTVNATFDDGEYALTIDMDRACLDELIMSCPGNTAQMIASALQERAGESWSMRMPEPVLINVTGKLGESQQSAHDQFVPLVANKIEPSMAPEPIAAVAALIALGREAWPFMEREDSEAKEQIQNFRSRLVTVGQRVNAAGSIELMRNVFKAAVRFLADEEIHLGRWIESVWDGIGQWRA